MSLEADGPQDWDLGLETGIWASRLGFEGGGTKKEGEEKEEEEKIPLRESIGHQPLRGRCPALTLNYNYDLPKQGTGTADHLMLLRLFHIPLSNLFQTKPIPCLS